MGAARPRTVDKHDRLGVGLLQVHNLPAGGAAGRGLGHAERLAVHGGHDGAAGPHAAADGVVVVLVEQRVLQRRRHKHGDSEPVSGGHAAPRGGAALGDELDHLLQHQRRHKAEKIAEQLAQPRRDHGPAKGVCQRARGILALFQLPLQRVCVVGGLVGGHQSAHVLLLQRPLRPEPNQRREPGKGDAGDDIAPPLVRRGRRWWLAVFHGEEWIFLFNSRRLACGASCWYPLSCLWRVPTPPHSIWRPGRAMARPRPQWCAAAAASP